ncbi:MAG TPA: carbamoyltransferase HypF [Chloroflexota bacterium]
MTRVASRERRELVVSGIVQGVGFRPFIYSLARRFELTGLVRNDADGVYIEVEGLPEALDAFYRAISDESPALAVIERMMWRPRTVRGETEFRIDTSRKGAGASTLVSPDVATCGDCLAELFNPEDRRFRYPFINCTNCGPRFTITQSVPYDRRTTTMNRFPMCVDCRQEYDDPSDRRFHAQPNACAVCGPRVRLLDRFGHEVPAAAGDPIHVTASLLREGRIVAVKGLGGYHLACNPFDSTAVGDLRSRKVRQDKPFALMARDLNEVETLCAVEPEEALILESAQRPIVLLTSLATSGVSGEVAPRQKRLGVMLAYTPLHYVLLHDAGIPLIMTSGNRCDEPIAYHDQEALERLHTIADYFLVHDRPIHMRCDDSVTCAVQGNQYPLRRSRGMAPAPIGLAQDIPSPVLACGGELKNTFCLAKGRHALLSHHVGDLENYETLRSFREGIDHFCALFGVHPELVAYDLHPEYLSTKFARDLEDTGMPAVGIQHHEAHIASCLADNQRPKEERAIGVAFDGTGYGTDGTIWGGEFFEGSVRDGFTRRAHLDTVPLPGGEAAIREPWRMALAYLLRLYKPDEILDLPLPIVQAAGDRNVRLIAQLINGGVNAPLTSSCGRLFDAVAALAGVPALLRATYEGQAAIELELASKGTARDGYGFQLSTDGQSCVVETREIIRGVVTDMLSGSSASRISERFHRTMADIVCAVCLRIRQEGGPRAVALSGGTWQNMVLLQQTMARLDVEGFAVYIHRRVPTNDGGLSLGQAVLADCVARTRNGEEVQTLCV